MKLGLRDLVAHQKFINGKPRSVCALCKKRPSYYIRRLLYVIIISLTFCRRKNDVCQKALGKFRYVARKLGCDAKQILGRRKLINHAQFLLFIIRQGWGTSNSGVAPKVVEKGVMLKVGENVFLHTLNSSHSRSVGRSFRIA